MVLWSLCLLLERDADKKLGVSLGGTCEQVRKQDWTARASGYHSWRQGARGKACPAHMACPGHARVAWLPCSGGWGLPGHSMVWAQPNTGQNPRVVTPEATENCTPQLRTAGAFLTGDGRTCHWVAHSFLDTRQIHKDILYSLEELCLTCSRHSLFSNSLVLLIDFINYNYTNT